MPVTRSEAWNKLRAKADACQDCGLSFFALHKVVCDPPEYAGKKPIVFIGEAPGEEENKAGIPFVGRAGKLLRENLDRIGLDPTTRAIINTIQCRPPQNRNPNDIELRACRSFLERKIEILAPRYLVALGKFASEQVLKIKPFPIMANAGKVFESSLSMSKMSVKIPTMTLPHPSWGLRGKQDEFAQYMDVLAQWLKTQGVLS